MLTGQEPALCVSPRQSSRPASPGLFVSPALPPFASSQSPNGRGSRRGSVGGRQTEYQQPDCQESPLPRGSDTPKVDDQPSGGKRHSERGGDTNIAIIVGNHRPLDGQASYNLTGGRNFQWFLGVKVV
jgi:hypothetical protein